MAKALGRNENMLTIEEKESIVNDFLIGMEVRDLIIIYNTTKRAIPKILKEYGINTKRKNRYTLNENYFEIIDTEHKAYWLGFIAADGCITNTNYFAIALKDEDILLQLKRDLEYTGDVYAPKQNLNTDYYRLNFSSKKLCDDLRALGIHECKSLSYNSLPNLDNALMPHFIRGYFDGDGSLYQGESFNYNKDRTEKYFNSYFRFNIIATESFCSCLNNYLKDIIHYEGKIHPHSNSDMYYYNVYSKQAILNLYNYLYTNSTVYLNRKYNIWQDFLQWAA